MALLFKWIWRLKNERSSLWQQVISSIHNLQKKPVSKLALKSIPGTWGNIVKTIADLENIDVSFDHILSCFLGTGSKTLFWLDTWIGESPLASRFPLLSGLDTLKSCWVADRLSQGGFVGSWKRRPRHPEELQELSELHSLLENASLSVTEDAWRSRLDADGEFFVRDLRHLIDSKLTSTASNPTIWLKTVPLKVLSFIWRACMDRIPSAVALMHRGVNIPYSACSLCANGTDSSDHLLASCHYTNDVLIWIFKWCDITYTPFSSVTEIVNYAANWGHCPKKRKIFLAIIYGTLWCVWKARNDKIFNKKTTSPTKTADCIIYTVFNWVNSRGNKGNCIWTDWVCCPFKNL